MEFKTKVLIVEDDPGITNFIKATLAASGYGIMSATTGAQALSAISSHCPDIILLDLGLPDMDGNTIIRKVRTWTATPIIVISARSAEDDKAMALDLGADDYLTKPFGTVEMMARVRTAMRHTHTANERSSIALKGIYRVGALTIDYTRRRVFVGEQEVHLTPNEFRIVALLGKHAGQVLTYKHLLTELWGPGVGADNKVIRVHMANIRRKIEPNPDEPKYIVTEVGIGYRMLDDETAPYDL